MSVVLIVEDDDDVSSLLSAILVEEGYRTVIVAEPASAAATASAVAADLVLLDVAFPGQLTGFDVLAAMREERPAVPVLMVTAEGERARIDDAIAAGARGYLVKPFDVDALIHTVRAALAA